MSRVVIGMDPHKRSATIEIIDEQEQVLAKGRYGTGTDGYQAMLPVGRQFSDRVWAVEGCAGIGRHIAQRLVADGENGVHRAAARWWRSGPTTPRQCTRANGHFATTGQNIYLIRWR